MSEFVSGFTAGLVSTVLLHPLDVIKTRYQVRENTHAAIRTQSLYRGWGVNVTASMLSWGLYFGLYDKVKAWHRSQPTEQLSPAKHLLASAEAGLLTCLVTHPLWLMKTRMVIQSPSDSGAYRNAIDGLAQIWKHEGFTGWYRGFIPALLGVSHGAIQFMAYEELKVMAAQYRVSHPHQLDVLEYIVLAATSKIVATGCTYPYQVVKSRLQVQPHYVEQRYPSVTQALITIYRNEGPFGFYKGFPIALLRVLPGTMITFGVYEATSRYLANAPASQQK